METFAPAANFSFSHSLFLWGNLMWWKAMVVCCPLLCAVQLDRGEWYFFLSAESHVTQRLLWFSSLTRSLAECEILRKTAASSAASSKWVGKIWFPRQMDFCNLRKTHFATKDDPWPLLRWALSATHYKNMKNVAHARLRKLLLAIKLGQFWVYFFFPGSYNFITFWRMWCEFLLLLSFCRNPIWQRITFYTRKWN